MPYQKPEIVSLGSATELILGGKVFGLFEINPMDTRPHLDAELDD